MSNHLQLIEKIHRKEAVVGVIGLGYVGLPLAIEFSSMGFQVVGLDIDAAKVAALNAGESYIKHIPAEKVRAIYQHARPFTASTDFSRLREIDCIIICVPTPLNKHREPDISFVLDTTRAIAAHLRAGQLVVLESSTYPGTTDEDMRAVLEATGLAAGEGFFLAYSPEREDPNNPDFNLSAIPKIVGGYTPACLEAAQALYQAVVARVVPVSSTRAAEAAKLLENIYRAVNIAMVNELKVLFDRMGIDVWEVIEAAKTKPFGFQAFYPGPGLGGHCIPVDPFYLTWKAREYDFSTRFIELAGEINNAMPHYVVERTVQALNERGVPAKGARILLLGLAYKRDVDDMRESPSLKLIELFRERGALVDYNDPYLPRMPHLRKYHYEMESVPLTAETLAGYDCAVIATDHTCYDYGLIVEHSKLVIDTRNATAGYGSEKVVKA